jgi:hypothetical protein
MYRRPNRETFADGNFHRIRTARKDSQERKVVHFELPPSRCVLAGSYARRGAAQSHRCAGVVPDELLRARHVGCSPSRIRDRAGQRFKAAKVRRTPSNHSSKSSSSICGAREEATRGRVLIDQHFSSSFRNRSRDIPAVRMLPRIISRPISAYAGMTTGRNTPCFSPTQWSPFPFLNTNPSISNTHRNRRHDNGGILLTSQNLSAGNELSHPRFTGDSEIYRMLPKIWRLG